MESDTIINDEQFLTIYPNRPYTTMRTLNGRLMLLDDHLQRLVDSANLMNITIKDSDFIQLKQQLFQIVKETEHDIKIMIVHTQNGFRIRVMELSKPKLDSNGGCTIEIIKAHRNMPKVKSTQWALQRHLLITTNNPDVEEYIIEDNDGNMLEGFSSNLIFITKDGDILSTDKNLVLQGTILKVVERLFNVKFTLINSFDNIKAMAICSTSRLVLPVNQVIDHEKIIELNSFACEEIQSIRIKVEECLTNTYQESRKMPS